MPHGHPKTTTFVAGLRTNYLIAPFGHDGFINRDAFEAYVEQVLVPELGVGYLVIMDKLSSHKGLQVAQMIQAAGGACSICRPTALTSTHREGLLQAQGLAPKAAERTVEGLWTTIGKLLDAFTPDECGNYYAAAGYDAT